MSLKHNQQGTAHLYIIIAVVVAVVIGLVGWRVWDARKTEPTPKSAASTAPANPAEKPAAEVTVNYVQPSSKSFRIGLPEGWTSSVCGDNGPDLLFMAPSADKLGRCASESNGTVAVSQSDGNTGYGADYYTSNAVYGSPVYTPITIDGISGYKIAYTVAKETYTGPVVGTKIIQYVLFDGTNSYNIIYAQEAGQPNLSAIVQTAAETFDKL